MHWQRQYCLRCFSVHLGSSSSVRQFEFVAVIPDKEIGAVEGSLGKLAFDSLKAISYPGGARMATFTACELDSLSDECDGEQEKFISK